MTLVQLKALCVIVDNVSKSDWDEAHYILKRLDVRSEEYDEERQAFRDIEDGRRKGYMNL